MSTSFVLNGKPTTLDADPNMPLLWAVREVAGLTGTKFGCGMALCGACTVHLDGKAIRSCVTPLSSCRRATRSRPSRALPASREGGAGGLGRSCRCPSAATASRARSCPRRRCWKRMPSPTDADIDSAMSGNICRCATYSRIRAAIHAAAEFHQGLSHDHRYRRRAASTRRAFSQEMPAR